MSTIAYKNGFLVADTLLSGDGRLLSKAHKKIDRVTTYAGNVCLIACTGLVSDFEILKRAVQACDDSMLERFNFEESVGFVLDTERIDRVWQYASEACILVDMPLGHWASGTGGDYAMGVMEAGMSAFDAVEVAKELDLYSGGSTVAIFHKPNSISGSEGWEWDAVGAGLGFDK